VISKRARQLLEGAIDLHVHPRPSTRSRLLDSREIVEQAERAGMRAVLLKDHNRPTDADAWHANALNLGTRAESSVCLNASAGGVNPAAAEVALQSGARAVFFPTDSARNDRLFWSRHSEKPGFKGKVIGEPERRWKLDVSVLDGAALVDEALAVIRLCAEAGALVCTGHLDASEISAVVEACGQLGARVCVTHAPVFTNADAGLLGGWASAGAFLELVAVFCCDESLPKSVRRSFASEAALVDQVGAGAFVLSSDLGQAGNLPPADGLGAFIDALLAEGIDESDIEIMVRVNPARALGYE
jgi:hypothetical protein